MQNDYDWGQSSVNASPLNLRNLGPGRSLLLINGHRVADYPMPYQGKSNFANYNNIPTGIVERIEVLTSGASAIYGSDAVAGVVNIILKKDIDGDTVRARYGTTTEGGRAVTRRLLVRRQERRRLERGLHPAVFRPQAAVGARPAVHGFGVRFAAPQLGLWRRAAGRGDQHSAASASACST